MTAYDEIHAMAAENATRPFVTMHDRGTGERAELSVASTMNAIAKMANLLVDELGLGVGDVVLVDLPLHWQAVGIIGGCWAAGVAVECGRESAGPVAAAFIGQDRLDRAQALTAAVDEVFAVSLAPFGMPIRERLPTGVVDLATAVRAHGDRFAGPRPRGEQLAIAGAHPLDHAGVLAAGHDIARDLDVPAGGRVLIEEGADRPGDIVIPVWLATLGLPVAVRGSVVLVRSSDPGGTGSVGVDALIAQERADRAILAP